MCRSTSQQESFWPQKELLKWHLKLGIGMYHIQSLMCEWHYQESDGKTAILPAVTKPKYATAQNCVVPPCQSCLLARAQKCSLKVLLTQALEDCEGALTRDQYEVGDFVSKDQFICTTPGRLPLGVDKNHKTAVFKVVPSTMMQHQV